MKFILTILSTVSVFFVLASAHAAPIGYTIAGSSAAADDATFVYYNPAGMTRIDRNQVAVVVYPTFPQLTSIKWKDKGSIVIPTRKYLSGHNGHNAQGYEFTAPTFLVVPNNDCKIWYGLGVFSPLVVNRSFSKHWKGRYYVLRSYAQSLNINPSIAYKVNDCLSIGFGVDIVYAHTHFTQAIDFGLLGVNTAGDGIPEKQDGKGIFKGNSWGFGVNVGLLYEFSENTRIALTYRSQQKLHFRGSAKFKHRPSYIGYLPPYFNDTRQHYNYRIPDVTDLGFYHSFNNCWAIAGDVLWTHWKLFKRSTSHLDHCIPFNIPHSTQQIRRQNRFAYGLSLRYTPLCSPWSFRTDLRYDPTPEKNRFLVDLSDPYPTSLISTLGVSYNFNSCLRFDFYYTHYFDTTVHVNNKISTLPYNRFRGGMKGHFDVSRNTVALQITSSF